MIYFAKLGEGDRTRIKIGCSMDPEKRMRWLANEFKQAVTLLAVMDGEWAEEQAMHDKFEFCRVLAHNELFHPVPELIEFMKPHLVTNK